MNAYRRGVRREKLTADRLRDDGYHVVESRGSHGIADLAALKPGQPLLVQVKDGKATLAHAEWNELFEAAVRAGAIPVVADWPKRGTLRLRRITGHHVPRSQHWPSEPFTTDQVKGMPVQ